MDGISRYFTRLAAAALFACMSIGSPPADALEVTTASRPATKANNDAEGLEVVGHFRKRYAETTANCGSVGRPAVLCSGLMIRGTTYSPDYKAWVPNPASKKAPGVSFSFLRHDAKYQKLAYGYVSGFVVYPHDYTPIDATLGLVRPEVLCIFPIDAATDYRQDKGCGASQNFPAQSKSCYYVGVTDAASWYRHYQEGEKQKAMLRNYSAHNYQCGFDVSKIRTNSAAAFNAALGAMALLGQQSFEEQNEIIVDGWQATPNKIGVEAFFYVRGSAEGKTIAFNNQRDFYQTVKAWRPVIRISLPRTRDEEASFDYLTADQYVPL